MAALRTLLIVGWTIFASGWTVAASLGAPSATPEAKAAERRLALVIGNARYTTGALQNPGHDARAVGRALEELGFVVLLRENLGLRATIEIMRDFSDRAARYDTRLFYYAGHAVQAGGQNFLIPVDADIRGEDEIPRKSANVTELVERLGQLSSGNNIVILDACRDNPFRDVAVVGPDGRRVTVRFRGLSPAGLAEVGAPAGMIVAFSTKPGQIALDGAGQPNSVYTKHLLANIRTPGLPIEQFFRRVRVGVYQETGGAQRPFEEGSLFTDFCFRRSSDGGCGLGPSSAAPRTRWGPNPAQPRH